MKFTALGTSLMMTAFVTTTAFAAPDWTHEGESDWAAIEDPSQVTVPLMYPYATCGIGKRQSPVDLGSAEFDKRINKLKFKYREDTPDFYNTGHAA